MFIRFAMMPGKTTTGYGLQELTGISRTGFMPGVLQNGKVNQTGGELL